MGDWNFHCGILGVATDAGEEEIRAAYRETAKLIHPDRHQQSEVAKRRFQQLNTSYKFLLDEIQTKEMPRPQRAAPPTPPWVVHPIAVGIVFSAMAMTVVWAIREWRIFPAPADVPPAVAPLQTAVPTDPTPVLSVSPHPNKHSRKKRAR